MDIPDIITRLADLDARRQQPPYLRANLLQFRTDSGSMALDCQIEDGTWYIMKCQNNPQETNAPRATGQPLKIVTTELICGRLGQLFSPPICPDTVVVEVPDQLAAATVYPNSNIAISSGPNVGSRRVESVVDSKFGGGGTQLVPPEQMARIVVFQTWLNGQDPAALVALDGSFALSIDHGWYFTGSQWIESTLADIVPAAAVTAQWPQDCLQDAAHFRGALDELMALPEDAIIEQFTGIPPAWGASPDFRARLVEFILRRRSNVEAAVAMLYKGAA